MRRAAIDVEALRRLKGQPDMLTPGQAAALLRVSRVRPTQWIIRQLRVHEGRTDRRILIRSGSGNRTRYHVSSSDLFDAFSGLDDTLTIEREETARKHDRILDMLIRIDDRLDEIEGYMAGLTGNAVQKPAKAA